MSEQPRKTKPKHLPVIVIGGFLGAGKTTLLSRLLSNPNGRKLAAIVNDIDQINIDQSLISRNDDGRIALDNGCICCSIKEDLIATLVALVENERAGPKTSTIDCIVIETSGVTNPASLVLTLKRLEDTNFIRLETLAYLVDGYHFTDLDYHDSEQILSHAAIADYVVLTKTDLCDQSSLNELEESIKLASNGVVVLRSDGRNEPDTADFLDLELLFSPRLNDQVSPAPAPFQAIKNHHSYESWSTTFNGLLQRDKFQTWVTQLTTDPSIHIWRSKGLLYFSDQPKQCYLYNQVGHRATFEPLPDEQAVDDSNRLLQAKPQLVFIGSSLSAMSKTLELESKRIVQDE